VAAALVAMPAAVAVGQAPAPPVNDHYLQSLQLNQPRRQLERTDTLRDVRDTTSATVQADVFNPGMGGGPAEVTQCGPTAFGKTVWYDFYPDVPGLVRLRASGFDSVIAVVPFNRRTFVPSFGRSVCVNDSSSTTEELLARVAEGDSYTVQIGGAAAGGPLEFLFDFLADTDGDSVLDDSDDCRLLAGTRKNGCPVRLRVDSTIRARPIAGGIEVLGLTVTAPRGSRVEASCSRGCPREVREAGSTVSLRGVRGKELAAGTSIVIRVSRKRAIGAYIRYRILDGNFRKTERCMNPGSRKPRRRCR
jgi:hypothetical protein